MRGKHGPIIGFEKIIDRALDRAEYELEQYCLSFGIRKPDLTGAYALAAAQRFGTALPHLGIQEEDQVPPLPLHAPARVQRISEAPVGRMALGGGETLQAPAQIQDHRGEEVAPKRGNSWARFNTPEKRRKEALRRMSLRKDGMAKKMMGKGPKKQNKHDKELQDLYLARSKAKKMGLPMPSLPSKPLSTEEKRARDAQRHREARAAAKEPKSKRGGSKSRLTPEEHAAKQRVYAQRAMAKAKGLPLPPLPEKVSELASVN